MSRFADVICGASESSIRSDVTLGGKLLLDKTGSISVSYAPFEHVQAKAKIVIVGITPGREQAANALCEVRRRLRAGDDHTSALAAAKVYASFSGPMRLNLIRMLDYAGVARWLEIPSTSSLWSTHNSLAHFTSALRYVVLDNGKDFNDRPDKSEPLRRLLGECLAQEARQLSDAFWLPLGPKADAGVQYIVKRALLDPDKVLPPLPHPSGSNNERITYFLGRKPKSALSTRTNPVTIDAQRKSLMERIAVLAETSAVPDSGTTP